MCGAGLAVCTDGTVSVWHINLALVHIWSCNHILILPSSPCPWATTCWIFPCSIWVVLLCHLCPGTHWIFVHTTYISFYSSATGLLLLPFPYLLPLADWSSRVYFYNVFSFQQLEATAPRSASFAYCFLAIRHCLAWSLYTSSDLSHTAVGIQNMLKGQYLMSPLILCQV